VLSVTPAFILGGWMILFSTKGARSHRMVGRLYLALMGTTSIAALFVHQVNPEGPFGFSWIHLFVPLTLWGIAGALYGAHTHNVPMHRNSMIGTFIGGLVIAGGFAFAPGRIMHAILFG
jgi:uncharacterized membrane protein